MARRQREGENVMGTLRLGVRDRIYLLFPIFSREGLGVMAGRRTMKAG